MLSQRFLPELNARSNISTSGFQLPKADVLEFLVNIEIFHKFFVQISKRVKQIIFVVEHFVMNVIENFISFQPMYSSDE